MTISSLGSALRNLQELGLFPGLNSRSWPPFLRLSALLRNRGCYLAAGVVSVGFGPKSPRTATASRLSHRKGPPSDESHFLIEVSNLPEFGYPTEWNDP